MSEKKESVVGIEPLIHKNNRPTPMMRIMALAFVGVVVLGFLTFFRTLVTEGFLLGILGILAMLGVFFLFSLVVGLIEFSWGGSGDSYSSRLLNSSADGICIVDENSGIVYANAAYGKLTGVSRGVDVQTLENVLSRHDEASNALFKLVNSAKRLKDTHEEFRLFTPIGRSVGDAHWYRVSVQVMSDAQGRDLTAWRLSDISDERDEQENYFQELQKAIDHLDRAPVGFFSADRDGNIQYLNATLAEWLGIDLGSFDTGSTRVKDLVAGDGVAFLNDVKAEPGATRTLSLELDMAKANGERLPVHMVHRVQTFSDGKAAESRTIVLNRSLNGGASSDLRSPEVRFTRFFNSTPMAIAALDDSGRVLRFNASFTRLFGQDELTADTGRPLKFETLIHERDRERFEKMLTAAKQNRVDIEPLDAVIADENVVEERHVRVFVNAVAPVSDMEEGDTASEALIVYAMDMTEQKALEAQMAQSQKMQAVGQLAGGIAHDFNNVLTAIIMASDLLLTNHRPSDPSFPDIMNIKQNANRAASLVRQLLAFSRRQTLRPEVLSLTDVLADLRMLLSRLIGNEINLTIEHGRDLWPVKVDLGQFEQVIVNLTVNARDAITDGGSLKINTRNVDEAEIKTMNFRGLEAADYVMIDVADTGTGIAADVLEKIFEPFFTTKEVGKGTGLGLSMVYGIIKQTGGYIYADSEVGEGTTFHILLPRHTVSEEEEASKPAQLEAEPEKKKDLSGSATVLLVEDEDAVRMGGIRALKSRGYTVHEASDGVEALEVLEELDGKVDLVVSDVVMPEMDGPSLLREIRKDYPHVKFIFVSGYAEDAFAKNLPEGAQFGFLPKPFSLKQLATVVKDTLDEVE